LSTPLTLAVVGAGPVGLALALLAAERLPQARITLWDARDAEADIHNDPRTLALSLGSIQLLRRLQAWPADRAQTIQTVHVSQTSATQGLVSKAAVMIHAKQEKLDMLGAVIRYGELISALQKRWFALVQQQPGRFF
jgi:2-octaprenyl-6-methoxyphenol hydroxylase